MKKEKEFKAYLESKCKLDYDVSEHISNVNYFNVWYKLNSMTDIIRTTKSVIMLYIGYLQDTSIKVGTINIRLNSLRKYFDCLIKLGYITHNPAFEIHIKGAISRVVGNPLSENTLNELYVNFESMMDAKPKPINITEEADNLTKQRYKLIVSLMVYQGLDTGELDLLNVTDIDIKKQSIYISSKNRRNSRLLKLEGSQILHFYEYIQSLPTQQTKLFSTYVQGTMPYLLSFIEPQVRNAEHIRQSRIMVWVRTLDIRTAQKSIGHKYVSSTEAYRKQDTSELVDEINAKHLFK
jgi:site-specific recombinase XerD